MTTSLYVLGEEFAALEAILLETGGEWTPEVEAKFTELGELEKGKLDAYASLCRSQDAYQKMLKDEETALREKRKVSENLVNRLRTRLQDYMEGRGLKEIRGNIWRAAIQKNGGMRALSLIVAPEQLPAEFQVLTVTADTAKLREMAEQHATEDQDPVILTVQGTDVARLEPRGSSVRFR